MNLSQRDQQIIWHPYTQMKTADAPIGIVRGEGAYLIAEDGSYYLDMISSWWVNLHGHANPYIAEKVSKQLSTLEHAIFAGFTHEPAVKFAEMLLAVLPENMAKLFYSDNGSTAVEVALKMAIQFWYNKGTKRTKILAFKNGYHGDTFGAMAVGDRGIFTCAFHDMLFEVIFVEVPLERNEEDLLKSFKYITDNHDDIAAFIFEPLVQGTAGMVMYNAGILDKFIEVAKANNIITIADEVMTGFGRTGKIFAVDYLSQKPDIICLSKGITGGTMPLGVTVCTNEIYSAFLSDDKSRALFHGHSYTANPLACTAAIASLELLLSPDCQKQIEVISLAHIEFKNKINTHPNVLNVRTIGSIIAIEIKTSTATSYLNNIRDYLYNFFLDKRMILRPLGNIIYLMPPYCIEGQQLENVYQAIIELLEELKLKKL